MIPFRLLCMVLCRAWCCSRVKDAPKSQRLTDEQLSNLITATIEGQVKRVRLPYRLCSLPTCPALLC